VRAGGAAEVTGRGGWQPMIVLLYGRDHVKGLCGPWNEADTAFWTALLSAAKTNATAQS
jgi:hypothetical protein